MNHITNNLETAMHIVFMIGFLAVTALHIVYLMAAATFLFILIDVPCSVVVLWKMRRKELELLCRVADDNIFIVNNLRNGKCEQGGPNSISEHVSKAKAIKSKGSRVSKQGKEEQLDHLDRGGRGKSSIQQKQQQKSIQPNSISSSVSVSASGGQSQSQSKSKSGDNCEQVRKMVAVKHNERTIALPPTVDKDNPLLEPCREEDNLVVSSSTSTIKDPRTSGSSERKGSIMSPISTFRQIFPLGACIIVLSIYFITRRKKCLRLPFHLEGPDPVPVPVIDEKPPIIEPVVISKKGDAAPPPKAVRVAPGVVISNRYLVERELRRGGFSKVYLGTDQKLKRKVAIKTANELLNQTRSLKKELAIYEDLQRSCSNLSIPYLINYSEVDVKKAAILVMDLLGPSLEDLFKACDYKFSHGTVTQIMIGVLETLKYFHGKSYIHRDIKPENILIGRLGTPDSCKIFLIDFGVVTNWCSPTNGKHVEMEYNAGRFGTNSYMSVNSHRGKTNSRKDDLESLGYCMYRFLKVNFPWRIYDDMADKIKCIVTAKMKTELNFEEEFPPTEFPKEFPEYLQYVRGLGFDAEPDYEQLKRNFQGLAERLKNGEGWDGLEWTKPEILEKLPEWIIPD